MKDKKEKKQNSALVNEIIDTFVNGESLKSDPNGSYTGKGTNPFSTPVQDQDDL